MTIENKRTDVRIQEEVLKELAWDTRLTPAEIGVQVKHGVVTLTGVVKSWAAVGAAEQAAHRIRGVLDVANDITVQLSPEYHRTDGDIAEAVRRALEWDVTVPDQQIRSTVSQGTVMLEGSVPYWGQRYDAARAVERLAGVIQVVNQITVEPTDDVQLDEARRAVTTALELHARREAGRINLRVTDHLVDVAGTVDTWAEKEAVLGAVRGTRGVRDVSDHLRIQPHAV